MTSAVWRPSDPEQETLRQTCLTSAQVDRVTGGLAPRLHHSACFPTCEVERDTQNAVTCRLLERGHSERLHRHPGRAWPRREKCRDCGKMGEAQHPEGGHTEFHERPREWNGPFASLLPQSLWGHVGTEDTAIRTSRSCLRAAVVGLDVSIYPEPGQSRVPSGTWSLGPTADELGCCELRLKRDVTRISVTVKCPQGTLVQVRSTTRLCAPSPREQAGASALGSAPLNSRTACPDPTSAVSTSPLGAASGVPQQGLPTHSHHQSPALQHQGTPKVPCALAANGGWSWPVTNDKWMVTALRALGCSPPPGLCTTGRGFLAK
ncbi:hypothetical protein TREES_T100001745 [Tupaia chinensis]|uniref:Uncharacterized protein n=1 Tax=Tupaia chinensis TaxID=246437 RepID=L9KP78_TUPCH|nr:hypothetical protein TREES_T100001745 [Tupaia chinensis]